MKFAERPMGSKRIIKAKEIAADLRSGMTAKELMIKYNVTPNTLRNMLRTLVNGRAISEDEANSVILQLEEGSSLKNRRKYPRYFVYVPLPIYDTDNLLTEGQVVDISEEGLRIRGIEAEPGDKKESWSSLTITGTYFRSVSKRNASGPRKMPRESLSRDSKSPTFLTADESKSERLSGCSRWMNKTRLP